MEKKIAAMYFRMQLLTRQHIHAHTCVHLHVTRAQHSDELIEINCENELCYDDAIRE